MRHDDTTHAEQLYLPSKQWQLPENFDSTYPESTILRTDSNTTWCAGVLSSAVADCRIYPKKNVSGFVGAYCEGNRSAEIHTKYMSHKLVATDCAFRKNQPTKSRVIRSFTAVQVIPHLRRDGERVEVWQGSARSRKCLEILRPRQFDHSRGRRRRRGDGGVEHLLQRVFYGGVIR